MTHDDPAAQRLIEFCERLPELPADAARARSDAQWVQQQFRLYRENLLQRCAASGTHEHERSALRLEADAFDAASSAVAQLVDRRFGEMLTRA